MEKKFKPSDKHLQIFKTIIERGKYKPAYSDHEPATKTLISRGLVRWNDSYTGVVLTKDGEKFVMQLFNVTF